MRQGSTNQLLAMRRIELAVIPRRTQPHVPRLHRHKRYVQSSREGWNRHRHLDLRCISLTLLRMPLPHTLIEPRIFHPPLHPPVLPSAITCATAASLYYWLAARRTSPRICLNLGLKQGARRLESGCVLLIDADQQRFP